MKGILTIISVAAFVFSVPAFAASNAKTGSGPNPYTDCGIGAALFPTVTWAAVSSNVIWDLGTTAVISATASPQTCSKHNMQTMLFIKDTYDSLVQETAAGEGEHLAAVLTLQHCSMEHRTTAVQQIRDGMKRVIGSADYAGKSSIDRDADLYKLVQGATASCSAVNS